MPDTHHGGGVRDIRYCGRSVGCQYADFDCKPHSQPESRITLRTPMIEPSRKENEGWEGSPSECVTSK